LLALEQSEPPGPGVGVRIIRAIGPVNAGENGLQVVGRSDRRGAALNFSPASDKVRAKYERVPVVAEE